LPEWLRVTQGYYLIVYAAAVMVMMAFCPAGVLADRTRGGMLRPAQAAEAFTDGAAT
jgi:branched-chain amino acid transport system permease protein